MSSRKLYELEGRVQGVGFRPFVFRAATRLGLGGIVQNTEFGALVEVEGEPERLAEFEVALASELPPPARIDRMRVRELEPRGERQMVISKSRTTGVITQVIPPDTATCTACLEELFDPTNRRYQHPFVTCASCGPRYTIMREAPYDRARTTMAAFAMCDACQKEYDDPADRRFHAQPIACPDCGPRLWLSDPSGRELAQGVDALARTRAMIDDGKIVAVKGLGGFHLFADPQEERAIERLRSGKRRDLRPLAMMVGTLEMAKAMGKINDVAASRLSDAAAPIVLSRRAATTASMERLLELTCGASPDVGVLLANTPVHHLLFAQRPEPLVATSGNPSGEPLCFENRDALQRLRRVADAFLLHDRPIARPIEDSIVRVMGERAVTLRRGRGQAPLPISVPEPLRQVASGDRIVARGGDLKCALAWTHRGQLVGGPHIGDLGARASRESLERAMQDIDALYGALPTRLVADAHPETYLPATRLPGTGHTIPSRVFHHVAHVHSALLEHPTIDNALAISWDGYGYGPGGAAWGGEFFVANGDSLEHVLSMRGLRVWGGDHFAREPFRAALSVVHDAFDADLEALARVSADEPADPSHWARIIASADPRAATSSVGRLFDAASALLGLCRHSHYEGHAAMALEHEATRALEARAVASGFDSSKLLPFSFDVGPREVDWRPLFRELIRARATGEAVSSLALRFHATLAEIVARVAKAHNLQAVVLTGGCFQNRVLTELTMRALEAANIAALAHEEIPPNDGGLAFGQLRAWLANEARRSSDSRPSN